MDSFNTSDMRSYLSKDGYVPPIDDRLHNIIDTINDNEEAEKALPGLAKLLDSYIKSQGSIDHEDFTRQMLLVFKKSPDQTYENTLKQYDLDEQKALADFVGGTSLEKATHDLPLGPTIGARQEAQQIVLGDEIDLPLAAKPSLEDNEGVHIQSDAKEQAMAIDESESDAAKEAVDESEVSHFKSMAAAEASFQSLNVSVGTNKPHGMAQI